MCCRAIKTKVIEGAVIAYQSLYLIANSVIFSHLGRQPTTYFICTGMDPTLDPGLPKSGHGIIELCSLVLHIFVYASVRKYKNSTNPSGTNAMKLFCF